MAEHKITGCQKHIALSRYAAAEGMVLLKNTDHTLPLAPKTKIALFGQASVAYVKGGGGSGDVNCAYVRNVYEGFRIKENEGKVSIFAPLEDFYKDHVAKEQIRVEEEFEAMRIKGRSWDVPQMIRNRMVRDNLRDVFIQEPEIPDALFEAAAAFADTAVITLSRYSGEGWDRDGRKGDFLLTDKEHALLDRVGTAFSRCIVVLDIGGVIDTNRFVSDSSINSVLLAWQAGMEGGLAIADILCGDANPSGKLATTFAKSLADYPSTEHFDDDDYYVEYLEDIYVGYRYFETLPGAAEKVNYCFGYGLSYTTFQLSNVCCGEENGVITAQACITNTGSCAGREVVQLYYSAPQGVLGKPAKALCAFAKTKRLAPGESQILTMKFPVSDMASYDDLGKIQRSAYILEKGDYFFHIGTSVRDTVKTEFVYTLAADTVVQQLSPRCVPCQLSRRLRSDGTYEALPQGVCAHRFTEHPSLGGKAPERAVAFDRVGKDISIDDFIAQFTDAELCDFMGASPNVGVSNTCSFSAMERLGVSSVPTADGPAGLRIDKQWNIPTTAWPCATLLASTWDPELVTQIGRAGGSEVRENGLKVWLTPALNIHRTPLCGRNFEYFSEDPLISGKMAAAKVRGIQENKVACSVKHFAANNRELFRQENDSRVSERALREIYLKGFEICVKESDPWTVMTSYNLLNGIHTSESADLIEGILREEWGFSGMVTTDWGIKNDPVSEVKAGNDMKMEIGYPEELLAAVQAGTLTRGDLEACAKRILTVYQRLYKQEETI